MYSAARRTALPILEMRVARSTGRSRLMLPRVQSRISDHLGARAQYIWTRQFGQHYASQSLTNAADAQQKIAFRLQVAIIVDRQCDGFVDRHCRPRGTDKVIQGNQGGQRSVEAKVYRNASATRGSYVSEIWRMLKETVLAFIEDEALSRGAAIALYTVTSIAPVLLIVIVIAGLAFGQDAAQNAITGQLGGLMGQQTAEVLQTAVASAASKSSGIVATIIGIITLVITASGVFGEMQTALNAIWKARAFPVGIESEGDSQPLSPRRIWAD